ncbi:hypothetical protein [Geminisphaera colitermitum]|uniref:hypothetical protein n=1 Tax=Geminisphaera colitermitum TaxID=1148786 RepID=UPI000158CACE|nr:hypothetical protein [Geminisphaera colitermitum]
MPVYLPREPRPREGVTADIVSQIIRYLRYLTNRLDTLRFPKTTGPRGSDEPVAPPLTLTTTPPTGWTPPASDTTAPDNVPFRFWLTFGTVDYSAPERVDGQSPFIAPVCEIPRNVSQTTTRRVHLECEWSGPINQYPLWTHVWLKEEAYTSSTPALTADPIDAATGWRLKFRLLLGYCYVSVTGIGESQTKTPVANNTDQGSFRSVLQSTNGYVQFTAADLPEHPPSVTLLREVVFFRNRRPTA